MAMGGYSDEESGRTHGLESVLRRADAVSREWTRNGIHPEHLLLALVEVSESNAATVLAALDVSPTAVRERLTPYLRRGASAVDVQRPLSPHSEAILELATCEAHDLGHPLVATDHLLLALTIDGDDIAAPVLAGLGLTPERLREAIRRLLIATPHGRTSATEPAAKDVVGGRCLALPPRQRNRDERIADARWQKELAVDAQEFTAAAAWRTEEKRLLAADERIITAWARDHDPVVLATEVMRLYRQMDRIRDLLGREGLTLDRPDADLPALASRSHRRPPPEGDRALIAPPTIETDLIAVPSAPPALDLPPIDEPPLPEPEQVHVRGWIEGRPELIAQVQDQISDLYAENWLLWFGWRFPPVEFRGRRHAFFGLILDSTDAETLLAALPRVATLAPAGSEHQLSGFFLSTTHGPEARSTRWTLTDRTVLEAPEH